MLGVLLAHALFFRAFQLDVALVPEWVAEREPLEMILDMEAEVFEAEPESPPQVLSDLPPEPAPPVEAPPPQAPTAAELDAAALAHRHAHVDWPIEAREAAKRVLSAEAEAERIAKMFAGPQGTWASLTKRERDQLNHFRWAPGVKGLERDENGNVIYRLPNGCALVNFMFFGCPIGAKPPPYGDLFKDMQLYFDEQRRPRSNDGNGTEPETRRP
jgi:hypothetical protein